MRHIQQHVLASAIILATMVVLGIHVFLFPMYTSTRPTSTRRTKIANYEQILCRTNLKRVKSSAAWPSQCPRFGIVSGAQGGRLGNQMWEYASVWATARRTGLEPFMPRCILDNLNKNFENLSIPPLSTIGDCVLDTGHVVNSLGDWNSTEQNIILPKYTADWSTVLMWLDDIRREFTFKKSLRDKANGLLKRAAVSSFNQTSHQQPITYVGVHVRRTDYIGYLWQRIRAKPAPISYYFNAMNYFSAKYERPIVYVVVSDNIEWCKYNFEKQVGKRKIVYASEANGKGAGQDLAVLAACNHSIIDYGTFGSFGAILAGGETVVYNISAFVSTHIAEVLPHWHVMT